MSTGNGAKKTKLQLLLALPSHETAERVQKALMKMMFEPIAVSTAWFLLLLGLTLYIDPAAVGAVLTALAILSPVWLPLYIGTPLWITWIDYIRLLAWFKEKRVVLEVQLPAEVLKSPQAMEVIFNGVWNNTGETTFISRYWKGRVRPIWSFEIASNEGRISFYIQCLDYWRNQIESWIYGQYSDAQIKEVPDYVDRVPFNLDEYDTWCAEYKKVKEPQALPIKLYTEYELNKSTDVPETKIDPLTNILELMNSMGKDEHLWLQYIVKARKNDEWYGIIRKKSGKPTDKFIEEADAHIKEIMVKAANRAKQVLESSDVVEGKMNALLTDGEKKEIEAIERSKGKPIFEVGIRIMYIAKKDRFRRIMGAPLFRAFESFRSEFNEIRGAGNRGTMVRWDYPWEDFRGIRKAMVKKRQFFFYKHRAYFFVPYDQVPIFLTIEELATLWHFPNSAVKTPGLNRVESRRSEAPSNIPVAPES